MSNVIQPDLTYITDGMWTRFIAQTPAGEALWREMAAQTDGTGAVLTMHAKATITQMRRAGYTVQKAKPAKRISKAELDHLFNELSA